MLNGICLLFTFFGVRLVYGGLYVVGVHVARHFQSLLHLSPLALRIRCMMSGTRYLCYTSVSILVVISSSMPSTYSGKTLLSICDYEFKTIRRFVKMVNAILSRFSSKKKHKANGGSNGAAHNEDAKLHQS